VSPSQILKELGYDDETIDRMLEELAAQQMANQVLQTPSPAPNVPDSKQRRATRDAERETQGDNRSNATRARAGAQPGA
jgi:SOS response regulatory protein OraA/RecX